MKVCNKCILTDKYPSITFDEFGVCSYCKEYEERWGGWQEHEKDYREFIDGLRKKKKRAVVGFSGGKDSSYLLHKLVEDYGYRDLLAVTFDNGFLSDGAKDNIKLMIGHLEVEHVFRSIDENLNKRLYREAINKKSAELCMFCMAPAVTALINAAKQIGAKHILMGSSPRTEPQFPFTMLNAFDTKFLKSVVEPEIHAREYFDYFKYAKPIQAAKVFFLDGIRFVNLPEFIEWNHDNIRALLHQKYGWVDHGKGVPHFDCLLEPLIDHFAYKRLGVSKVDQNLSILVRSGQLTREEALEKYALQNPDEVPQEHIDEFCRRLEITEAQLLDYLEGNSKDYSHFSSNAALIKRYSFLLKLAWKLKIIPSLVYKKYA